MAIYDKTDVTMLYWKQDRQVKRLYVQVGTLSRLDADKVLGLIVATLPQGSYDCGYTVSGGGHVPLFY